MEMDQTITLDSGQYGIRPYQRADKEAVIRLWETVFEKPLNRDYWDWKYFANPYGQRIMLATSEAGEPLVFYGGIPYRANLEGRTVEVIHLMDIMSHPAYRKTGLFVKTVEAFIDRFGADDRAVLFYGFPGQYHFQIGNRYLKYRELSGGANFWTADPRTLSSHGDPPGEIFEIAGDAGAFDELWLKNAKYYPFSIIRDAKFINWRFKLKPEASYEIYGYRVEPGQGRAQGMAQGMAGYAVFVRNADAVVMADMLMPPDKAIFQGFMTKVADRWVQKGIKRVETWLPANHFLNRLLSETGFSRLPEPLGFIPTGRSFASFLPLDWVVNHMYYSMADADLF